MIRINLLPFRAARKKENIRRQLSIYAGCVVITILALAYFTLDLKNQLSNLKEEEQKIQADLKSYEKTIRKIKKLEKQIREIKAKLDVIKELEKKKTGPVLLLDQISQAVPKEKLWLTSLVEKGGKLTLTGTAMDNETVALFMTNLKKQPLIENVDLKQTASQYLSKYRLRVSNFSLECKTNYGPKKTAPEKTK